MGPEPVFQHLPVPLWNRHLIWLCGDSIPKRPDVFDLIVHR